MDKFVNCVLVLIFNLFVSNRRKNFHKLKEWPKSVMKYPVGIKNYKVWPEIASLKLKWFLVMVLSCLNLFFIYLVGLRFRSDFLGPSLLGLTFYRNSERVGK